MYSYKYNPTISFWLDSKKSTIKCRIWTITSHSINPKRPVPDHFKIALLSIPFEFTKPNKDDQLISRIKNYLPLFTTNSFQFPVLCTIFFVVFMNLENSVGTYIFMTSTLPSFINFTVLSKIYIVDKVLMNTRLLLFHIKFRWVWKRKETKYNFIFNWTTHSRFT